MPYFNSFLVDWRVINVSISLVFDNGTVVLANCCIYQCNVFVIKLNEFIINFFRERRHYCFGRGLHYCNGGVGSAKQISENWQHCQVITTIYKLNVCVIRIWIPLDDWYNIYFIRMQVFIEDAMKITWFYSIFCLAVYKKVLHII